MGTGGGGGGAGWEGQARLRGLEAQILWAPGNILEIMLLGHFPLLSTRGHQGTRRKG